MFQSEVAVAEHRGRGVGLHGFMFVAGVATLNWIALGAYCIPNLTVQWRLVIALQAVSPLILLGLRFWLPEPPRWLVQNGRGEEAYRVLQRLHDTPTDVDHRLAYTEYMLICKQVDLD